MSVLDDPHVRAELARRIAAWPRWTPQQREQLAALLRPASPQPEASRRREAEAA